MTKTPTNSVNHQRPAFARGAHGRLYIFSVVMLAVFFALVMVWRQPPRSYTARVVVEQTGNHGELNNRDAIVAAIRDVHLHHVAEGGCTADHGHDHGDLEQIIATGETDTADAEQPHLLVDVDSGTNEMRISIWCASGSKRAAKDEADRLASAYVRRVNQPSTPPSDGLEEKAATGVARQAFEHAESDLNAFLKQHAEILSPSPAISSQAQSSKDGTTAKKETAPLAVAQPNPVWVELDDRLQVLLAARNELLEVKTESHPEVRDLQWQIEKVEAEIALVPTTLPSPAATNETDAVENEASLELPAVAQHSPEILEKLGKLKAAVAAARRQYDQAQAAEEAAQASAAIPSTAVATIVASAKIVSSRGAGASRAGVFGGGMLALLIGGIVAWRSRVLCSPAAIVSLQRVEALGVPVVAAISSRDGPEYPAPQIVNPAWIAWLAFACELVVAAIALLLLLTAIADWQMAAQLMSDPLSALGEAASRLW